MTQLGEMRDAWGKFQAAGIRLYAISYDDQEALSEFSEKQGIPHPLLSDLKSEDAVYQYSMGAGGMRVARGRAEIRRLVMERDMRGFAGWKFPYEWVTIDGDKVITKWWNQAPANREDGTPYRVLGNSNIRFNNDLEIVEMHDNFDLAALIAMVQMLNRKGLTKIRIPDAEESENL